jgi:GntR family carbon starvation induced transcriptional regulator
MDADNSGALWVKRTKRLSRNETAPDEQAVVPASLTQLAWQSLRDDIICGKLRPKMRLRINKLRDLYGIGASPLREALSRLVPDGFVVSMDRRGFMVAPISLKEFRDLTDLRKLLEKEAVRFSLLQGDDAWEGRLLGASHRLAKAQAVPAGKMSPAMKEWETLNEEFYEALASACTSTWLLNFRRLAYYYAKRYLRVCLSADAIRELHNDHRALVDAALERDIQRMHALIDDQLERAYRKVELSRKL